MYLTDDDGFLRETLTEIKDKLSELKNLLTGMDHRQEELFISIDQTHSVVDNVSRDISKVVDILAEAAKTLEIVVIIQEQAAKDKIWYQNLIYRIVAFGGTVILILLGIRIMQIDLGI